MNWKMKKIWYCEFCGKHYHCNNTKHEKHCTANPDRMCRLCNTERDYHAIVRYFKKRTRAKREPDYYGGYTITVKCAPKLSDIRDSVDQCPPCILTVMRLTGLTAPWFNLGFDYKEEREKWWGIINSERMQEEEQRQHTDFCRSQ